MRREDKNGEVLKVGDKVKNKDGETRHIANVNGETKLIRRGKKGNIEAMTPLSEVDLTQMVKVA